MDFIKKYPPTPINVLKAIGILFGGIVIISVVLSIFKISFPTSQSSMGGYGMMAPMISMEATYDGGMTDSYSKGASYNGAPSLSIRNILPYPIRGEVTGNNAEDFEVTDYNATIETRSIENTCKTILNLKANPSIIFESSNQGDHSCSYTFKATLKEVPGVLALIETLNPKDVSENTYTIKRQIDDFTSEKDILEKKRTSLDKTLEEALRAYNEISSIAVRANDASSLAKIIDSKIQLIERITNEKVMINEALDRLSRSKTEQMDRLNYTFFNVTAYENKLVDGEALKDSWKYAVKNFINTVNKTIQDITLSLVAFLLSIVQIALYAVVIVIAGKYGWRFAQKIWKK